MSDTGAVVMVLGFLGLSMFVLWLMLMGDK